MKFFAFYLPQFHEIKENDEWWGEGFTEWINVKKAEPLYEGHAQPQIPLNENYYNLLEKKTVEWQTALMRDYKIDGLIYYHYYFEGKKLLEKPAENLLINEDINQKFFFCWANHSWQRTWEGKKDILVEQTYGSSESWEKHFQYLLPFFKDKRYEKKNNKPLFMIFKSDIPQSMFTYFDKRCKEEGFSGIHVIETFHGTQGKIGFYKSLIKKSKQTKNIFVRQPSYCQRIYDDNNKGIEKNGVRIYDGDNLFDIMLKDRIKSKYAINGLFFSWDNTPRHAKRGYVITPPSKKIVYEYINKCSADEYVFINAWNEWAEGMILEPTERDGYKYLEWIREWNMECK